MSTTVSTGEHNRDSTTKRVERVLHISATPSNSKVYATRPQPRGDASVSGWLTYCYHDWFGLPCPRLSSRLSRGLDEQSFTEEESIRTFAISESHRPGHPRA